MCSGLAASFAEHYAQDLPQWQPWVAALVTTVVLFGSVLVHELSHSLVAQRLGIHVRRITLFVFGGVAQIEEEPRKPIHELLIALAGPLTSIVFAGLFGGLAVFFRGLAMILAASHGWRLVAASCAEVGLVNLALAAFNMIPGFPLDGGRVLRAILWSYWGDLLRATRVTAMLGQLVGLGVATVGVYTGITAGSALTAIFYVLMGLMLMGVARNAYRYELLRATLAYRPIGDLAALPQAAFRTGTPLSVAAPYVLTQHPTGLVPILYAAQPVGLLSWERVRLVPRWQWTSVAVEDVMQPLTEAMLIRDSQSALEAMERLADTEVPELLVLDDWGNLRGVVSSAVLEALLSKTLHQAG